MAEAATANGTSFGPELDVPKLHSLPSEQQDLYLLTFTADLASYASALPSDDVSANQPHIKKELFQIVNLSSPAPTRVIRNNLARTFAAIFAKGDRKALFESVNELVSIITTGKSEKEIKAKHAAVRCLGAIFEVAGDSAISLSTLSCVTLVRSLKLAQNHAGFRASIFKALGRVIKGIRNSVDETVARDLSKQARSAASGDKSLLVQANATFCLEQLVQHTAYFDNSNDYDKLRTAVWKIIESPSPVVRHSAASCLSAALLKGFSESPSKQPGLASRKSKKVAKRPPTGDAEDDEPKPRPGSPAPQQPATQLTFTLPDLLRQLSTQYCRQATSNRGRAGIAGCYVKLLERLGRNVVENSYSMIALHLFQELLSHPSMPLNRYRLLLSRKHVGIILERVIGRKMLGEPGQLDAARFLVNDIIKNYPQALKERPEPNKQTLVAALSALSSLMRTLGSAVANVAESCREGLLQVLQHPSYAVQVQTSRSLQDLVRVCPQQLLPTVSICMNSLDRELNLLTGPRKSHRRCTGYANGLAATLSIASSQPLYGSVDVYSRLLSQATTLLKASGSSDIRVSSIQVQVAWILIGGLMSLGPDFTRIHLPQLLLLWKNALPKPPSKDHVMQRNFLELTFLTHVRECALGAMSAFLEYNSRLLTADVSKRLAAMLQHTLAFSSSLPSKKTSDDLSQRLSPSLQLYDLDLMVRRRVFHCYMKLVSSSSPTVSENILQSDLLLLALSSFADPEAYVPSSLSASIASSAGTFESIWDVGDNWGFGVNGLVRGFIIKPQIEERSGESLNHWCYRNTATAEIDRSIISPVCGAEEHDSVSLYTGTISHPHNLPDPPATEVVNAAIKLFAAALPLQSSRVQESILEQMSTFLNAESLQRDPGRKAAMTINVVTALLAALKVAAGETRLSPGDLGSPSVEKALHEQLNHMVISPDQYVRSMAAQALGRLCNCSGNLFTTKAVSQLIDLIVSNRDPNARAGCALALGCIHSQLGGMAAAYHLNNIHGILSSLASDPHPTVHFWALDALSRVADSAGLTFTGHVSSTLGLLAQIYTFDSHNEEAASTASSNLELDVYTTTAIARCVDSIINVLGPDLQDKAKTRDMFITLVGLFETESDPLVVMESLKCLEHLWIYAPGHMELERYVRVLQKGFDSSNVEIRETAINGLHNLMKRGAEEVLRIAGPGLEDKLWLVLDHDPRHEAVKNLIGTWLEQTWSSNTGEWVHRCYVVLSRTKFRESGPTVDTDKTIEPDLQDEEAAGFNASVSDAKDSQGESAKTTQELLRWQVRAFAMDCLSEIFALVGKDASVRGESAAETALQQKIAEVIRISFSASTDTVVELRIKGLQIVDQVLKIFGKKADPDFPEASLLEQYQAQISSALTPAFATDASPELAAEAINVCATFVATGIVTDVDRMGRILNLLVSALDSFSRDTAAAAIGELRGLSPNAHVMVKLSIYSAWAELQIASGEQRYLVDVVKPHIPKLTPLWLSTLREFARLKYEPDVSITSDSASMGESLDTLYVALNRRTLLKFYQDSWLNLVEAIATLIDEDSESVFDALDGKLDPQTPNGKVNKDHDINYRDEPVAFFFVLFGIAFEALVSGPSTDSTTEREDTLATLSALQKILRPSVSGNAVYQDAVFSEIMEMLDRLVLTEGLDVQAVVVEIARNLCLAHPSGREGQASADDESLSDDIDQLFELTRIIVLVLAGLVPNLTQDKSRVRHDMTDEAVSLIQVSFNALVDAADVFPAVIRTDLHACILHIFATILGTGTCQAEVIHQAFPMFRRFVTTITRKPQPGTVDQIRSALSRFLSILKNAQKRESEASLPCEKNTFFACTILITSSSGIIPARDPLLRRFILDLTDALDNPMTSKVAANCSRSLLVMSTRGKTEEAITALLLPRLIAFLSISRDIEGIEEAKISVAQALASFVSTIGAEQQQLAMALIIPALLARGQQEGRRVYKETAARLLEIAAINQSAFREVVARLGVEQKVFLETVLREGGVGAGQRRREEVDAGASEPSIALKMDFG